MYITCLDMEGVLTPEIWVEFSKVAGIPELTRTTRDEPDYAKLMDFRIGILNEHGYGLKEIRETIDKIEPLPGARAFLDELRSFSQVVILSDTFEEFTGPLMDKLGWPTIFCHQLVLDEEDHIVGFKLRCEDQKLKAVEAFQSIGYDTIAAGDSLNDLHMIRASKAGFLFRSTDAIKAANPDIESCEEYDELLSAIRRNMD